MLKALYFKSSGAVPNNPTLPVLVYSGAFPEGESAIASGMEERFAENGWPPQWRNGIYPFHHYHCEGHEVLGIAAGEARLVLGGDGGEELTVRKGDVLLLPAGTGHCLMSATPDLIVVGAYPPDQQGDIQRDIATTAMKRAIAELPYPKRDPVLGSNGPLLDHWR
jgi:uncharacterized protein YjlB